MKIAIWHNLPSGGGKRALYYHVKGLVERGHEVEAWCPEIANTHEYDAEYLPLSDLIVEHRIPFEWHSFRLFGRSLSSLDKNAKLRAMDEHCRRCAEEIQKSGAAILFANSCSLFRTTAIGRFVNLPSLLYLQEPYRWLYEALPQLPWRAQPPSKRFFSPRHAMSVAKDQINIHTLRIQAREEYENAKAFDRILVNSLFSRESVLRAYGLDSKVCYLGIDSELFRPADVHKERMVIGLGAIYFGKRVDRAIRALATIEESKRPKLLWLGNVGGTAYLDQMNDLARELGVSVEFRVGVPDEEIVEELSRASVMIYTPQLEPFGMAPLEANACGTPVVAIAEGGVRETIIPGINGFLVNDDNPQELGDSIIRLLDNPELVTKMSNTSRQQVLEHWQWNDAVSRLEEHLDSLVTDDAQHRI